VCCTQVVKALHYLQAELKVIHRDVKPSNILINRNGEVKICDFGISGNLVDSVAKTIDAGCKPYMAVSATFFITSIHTLNRFMALLDSVWDHPERSNQSGFTGARNSEWQWH